MSDRNARDKNTNTPNRNNGTEYGGYESRNRWNKIGVDGTDRVKKALENETPDDVLDELREDIVIPEIVQKKADRAFDAIRQKASRRPNTDGNVRKIAVPSQTDSLKIAPEKKGRARRRLRKKIWILAAAAVLAFGTLNVAAAYRKWSRSLGEGLKAEETQQQKLQENHMASFVNQSCTDQGITVTALQSITDNYFTHISFQVEGYSVDRGEQPDFGSISVTVNGEDDFSWVSDFYDGLVAGEDGTPQNADGTPINLDESGSIVGKYVADDGSMEYNITLFHPNEKGYFLNKPIHVEMLGLGTVKRAEYQPGTEGKWTFDWTLGGSPESKICELNVPLGDTGATLVRVELSPISMMAEYEFPRQEQRETYRDANGREQETFFYAEPPRLRGVRMKDGTLYPNLYLGPGASGYQSESGTRYRTSFAIDRILDTSQIDSLLFDRPVSKITGDSAEGQFYIVPIG